MIMKTKSIVKWFQTQGMPQAAAQFSDKFDDIEDITYQNVFSFLSMIDGDDEYIFLKLQRDVSITIL